MDTKIILNIDNYRLDINNLIGCIKYKLGVNLVIDKIANNAVNDFNINDIDNGAIRYQIKKHYIAMFNGKFDVNTFFISLNLLVNTYIKYYDYDNDYDKNIDNDCGYYACYMIDKLYQS